MIAYQTAYLKAHYPVQFMAALLTQDMGNQDKTIKNIAECREMGIEILPPDVNESMSDFSVAEGRIRFGLAAVKNVGLKAVEYIIEERKQNGPFRDLMDFCRRVSGTKVNKRVLEGLIECGAMDFTGIYRSKLFAVLDDVLKFSGLNHDPNQLSMFALTGPGFGDTSGLFEFPDIDEWDERERLKREKEALGFYITGHPLLGFGREIERFSTCTVQDLTGRKDKEAVKVAGVVENLKIKRTKRGDRMATFTLEDMSGSVEVIIFPDLFSRFSPLLKGDEPLLVSGIIEGGEISTKIIAQEVSTLEALRHKSIKAVKVKLDESDVSRNLLERLRDVVFKYPGECRLIFGVNTSDGKEMTIYADDCFRVLPCPEMTNEIEALVGKRVHQIY
jgi:DNA polymerase-3 subunit alpha